MISAFFLRHPAFGAPVCFCRSNRLRFIARLPMNVIVKALELNTECPIQAFRELDLRSFDPAIGSQRT